MFLSPALMFFSSVMIDSLIISFKLYIITLSGIRRLSLMQPLLSLAPMLDRSHTHFRSFARILTSTATLYSEMLHQKAVVINHRRLLPFEKVQHPVILQLGGASPQVLFKAAQIAASYGYDGINFNVGCPSSNVQQGCFGAVLMRNPLLVGKCLQAIQQGGALPVSVKCRLGVDDDDSYEFMTNFIEQTSQIAKGGGNTQTNGTGKGGVRHFIIHARKALLKGLNPAKNRTLPPLMYDRVFQLKQDFPSLRIQINGGITSIQKGLALSSQNGLDGCMVGRLAFDNPIELLTIDPLLGKFNPLAQIKCPTLLRQEIMMRYADYLERLACGEVRDEEERPIESVSQVMLLQPILNLYRGQLNGGKFRNRLSEFTLRKDHQPSYKIVRELAQWITQLTFEVQREISSIKGRQGREALAE